MLPYDVFKSFISFICLSTLIFLIQLIKNSNQIFNTILSGNLLIYIFNTSSLDSSVTVKNLTGAIFFAERNVVAFQILNSFFPIIAKDTFPSVGEALKIFAIASAVLQPLLNRIKC